MICTNIEMVNNKIKPAHYFILINIVKCDNYTSDPAVIHPTQAIAYVFLHHPKK